MARRILILLTLLTAACGSKPASPINLSISNARFSDADPHDWQSGSPTRHPVHGIDTSRFQGAIDWPTARANGVNFAFLKATEGADRVDEAFAQNWDEAARAGIPRGAYHFFYHCGPAEAQARWFIAHVPRHAAALPPVLDIEFTPTSPTCRTRPAPAQTRAEAARFLALVAAYYGQRPIVYTTTDFYAANDLGQLQGVDFWLRSTAAHPSETFPGQPWLFWQYSGTGLVPGINHRTDLNVFAGSARAWADWLSSHQP